MYKTVQTQALETIVNEYEIVKKQKADPPGIEFESDFDDDIEFIGSSDAIPREDATDEEANMEFVVSSEEIEEEMKAAGVLSK